MTRITGLKRTVPIAALALLLAACGPAANQVTPVQGEAPVSKEYGGILQAGPNAKPAALYWYDAVASGGNGHRTSFGTAFENLVTHQFDKPGQNVLALAVAGKIAPALAESWKQPDPKTYEFVLRKGVKWHDGEEFSSKDVIWSLRQWGENIAAGDLRTLAGNMERVEAQDTHAVRIVLKNADPDFLAKLAHFGAPKILPAHPAEKAGNLTGAALRELYNKIAIGTGPFKLRSFEPTKATELERFDGYWRGKPYLDGIRLIYGLDRSSQQAALVVGELDFASLNDKVQAETVMGQVPGATKLTYSADNTPGVEFNLRRKPWDDIRVRRAIHLGLDRQAVNATAFFDEGVIGAPSPVVPPLTAEGWGMQPDEYLKLPGWRQPKEQDIAEAKRLLAEAGIAPGYKVAMKFKKGSGQPAATAEPTASSLNSIGLSVTVQPMEDAAYLQSEKDRDFDLRMESGVGGSLTPGSSAFAKWNAKGTLNVAGLDDREMDRLTDAALTEMDQNRLKELLGQMQRRILENVYYVPVPSITSYQVIQPWLHDFYGSLSVEIVILNAHATWMEAGKLPKPRQGLKPAP